MKLSFSLKRWLGFISCLLLAYGITQGIANNYFLVDKEKLTWRNNVENIFIVTVLATVVFVFGNYSNTFPNVATVLFILTIPIAWVFFEKYFDTVHINNVEDWDANQRKMNISLLIVVLVIVLAHIYIAKKRCMLIPFLFYIFLIGTVVTVLYLTSTLPDAYQKSFFLKYWLVGWLLAFFTRFKDSTWSELGAGFALGTFIYGFALYRDSMAWYECRETSYFRCNNNGPRLCEAVGDPEMDYGDANWYSIIIIGGFLLLLVLGYYFRKKYIKKSRRKN